MEKLGRVIREASVEVNSFKHRDKVWFHGGGLSEVGEDRCVGGRGRGWGGRNTRTVDCLDIQALELKYRQP